MKYFWSPEAWINHPQPVEEDFCWTVHWETRVLKESSSWWREMICVPLVSAQSLATAGHKCESVHATPCSRPSVTPVVSHGQGHFISANHSGLWWETESRINSLLLSTLKLHAALQNFCCEIWRSDLSLTNHLLCKSEDQSLGSQNLQKCHVGL